MQCTCKSAGDTLKAMISGAGELVGGGVLGGGLDGGPGGRLTVEVEAVVSAPGGAVLVDVTAAGTELELDVLASPT
jgi:hypothetical protein